MSAVRERGGRRTPLRRALALAVALSAAFPLAAWSSAPVSAAVADEPATVEVLAAPVSSGTVREGQALSVRVTLSNTGARATGPLSIELRLDGTRPAPADELSRWFEQPADSASPTLDERLRAAQASVDSLEPGASAVLDLTLAASSPLWGGPFGARLAEVAVSEGGTWLAVDRTAIVRVPDGAVLPSAATTFVQPISTPGESDGLLSAETLEAATSEAGSLTRALTAAAGRPVLLAIDPRVVASIRALGGDAPVSALDFLARLEAAPNESFLLPWADADPIVSFAAGESPLPRPEGTGTIADDVVLDDAGETPAPSNEPDDQPEQGTAVTQPISELLDLTTTLDAVIWPSAAGISASTLAAAADDGARMVITPSSVLDGDDPVQGLDGTVLLRADDALADAAQAAVHAQSQQRFDRAIARVSALLASSAATEPGTPAIIALDRSISRGGDRLLDTLAQTISLPWSSPGTVAEAVTRSGSPAVVIDAPLGDVRQAAVAAALEAEAADRQFAQIAQTPAVITDARRLDLLAALSLGWGDDTADALRGFVSDSQRLRASVQVVESSAILLLTDRATLPVTVQNDLDVAVRVFVRVEPDTAQLRVLDSAVEAIVEPQSQARTLVPVESLTNGDVDITVTVRDAQNRELSEPTRVSLSLQAGWETAGVIVVAIAVALLFVVGIARDLRKRGRRTAEPSPTEEAS